MFDLQLAFLIFTFHMRKHKNNMGHSNYWYSKINFNKPIMLKKKKTHNIIQSLMKLALTYETIVMLSWTRTHAICFWIITNEYIEFNVIEDSNKQYDSGNGNIKFSQTITMPSANIEINIYNKKSHWCFGIPVFLRFA